MGKSLGAISGLKGPEFEAGYKIALRVRDNGPIRFHDIESLVASPDAEVVVAVLNESLIGSGFALKKASLHYTAPAFYAQRGFIYVVPEHRGKA